MTRSGLISLVILTIVLLDVLNTGHSVPLQGFHVTQRVPIARARKFCIPHSTFTVALAPIAVIEEGDNFVCTTERCGNTKPRTKSYG